MTFADRIRQLLATVPGLTDREITNRLKGSSANQQHANTVCRELADRGTVIRRARPDGLIGNYLAEQGDSPSTQVRGEDAAAQGTPARSQQYDAGQESTSAEKPPRMEEDFVKSSVQAHLAADGWKSEIAWGKAPGIDILAQRGKQRWIIEAKGGGRYNPMNHNYFLGVLGTLIQHMNDSQARYSIALPDIPQFRRLWARMPTEALSRTRISALFVNGNGHVEEAAREVQAIER